MLSGALPGMDPRIRQALTERLARLGLNSEALQSGRAGEVLANTMMSRIGQKQQPAAAGIAPKNAGTKTGISLDKGWHGVHYLLCGAAEPNSSALGQAVMDGIDIGEDFGGYGEARYFTPEQVADRARARPREPRNRD